MSPVSNHKNYVGKDLGPDWSKFQKGKIVWAAKTKLQQWSIQIACNS